jgi:hypothetical protein
MGWISDGKVVLDIVMKFFGYVKEDKQAKHKKLIGECAQVLRNFAASARTKQPNLYCFPKQILARQLGSHASLIDEVIGFMEEKGWASKVVNPADCWKVN